MTTDTWKQRREKYTENKK